MLVIDSDAIAELKGLEIATVPHALKSKDEAN